MWLSRSVGVNLHPTSLPGGRLGPEAYAFVDWLAAAGARFWQVLPLNPPDDYGSPYASDVGVREPGRGSSPTRTRAVGAVRAAPVRGRERLLDRRLGRVRGRRRARRPGAVPARVVGPARLRRRARRAADRRRADLRRRGQLRPRSRTPSSSSPTSYVAGAPPDPLNELGQKWGNPLYDWDALAREGYRWWTERLRRMLGLFDVFRIDHFRGFAGYWAVPARETARDGPLVAGPGAAVFLAAERELGKLPVIVEDLGMITPDVPALRDALGFPGMAILLWAFEGPDRQPTPAREPSRPPGRLHLDPRHRHACRDVPGRARRGRSSSWRSRRAPRSGWCPPRTCSSSGRSRA